MEKPALYNNDFFKDNQPCDDPNGNKGSCTPFRSCSSIFTMLSAVPISPKNRDFVKNSQCGFYNRVPYVCCAKKLFDEPQLTDLPEDSRSQVNVMTEASPTPDWMLKLLEKMPQPPVCGADAQEKIVGGNLTAIDEFPWTVLLEYAKRK